MLEVGWNDSVGIYLSCNLQEMMLHQLIVRAGKN